MTIEAAHTAATVRRPGSPSPARGPYLATHEGMPTTAARVEEVREQLEEGTEAALSAHRHSHEQLARIDLKIDGLDARLSAHITASGARDGHLADGLLRLTQAHRETSGALSESLGALTTQVMSLSRSTSVSDLEAEGKIASLQQQAAALRQALDTEREVRRDAQASREIALVSLEKERKTLTPKNAGVGAALATVLTVAFKVAEHFLK